MTRLLCRCRTVQGIGDIFWCYQKLAPRFEAIHFDVLTIDNGCVVQTRAREFLNMLPQVASFDFIQVTWPDYVTLAATKCTIPEDTDVFPYSINRWLEEGRALDTIDDGPVLERISLRGIPDEPQPTTRALALFVADQKEPGLWTPQQWASRAGIMLRHLGATHIDMIGAEWDRTIAGQVGNFLDSEGITYNNLCGRLGLAASVQRIRSAMAFFGFQSGLNVLAENYDVPQLMVYYDKLAPMMHTWKKPASRAFHAITFSDASGFARQVAALRDSIR